MLTTTQLEAINLLLTEELRVRCRDPRWAGLLEREVEVLPLQQQIAVQLFFLGLTYRRIAALLDITPCQVRELSAANEEVSAILRRLAQHV